METGPPTLEQVPVSSSNSKPSGQLVQLVALKEQVAHELSQSLHAPYAFTYYPSSAHVALQTPAEVNLK